MTGNATYPEVTIDTRNNAEMARKERAIARGEATKDPRLDSRNFRSGITMQEFQATLPKDSERPFSAFAAGVKICNPEVQDLPLGMFL
jgi:hypothetical protein